MIFVKDSREVFVAVCLIMLLQFSVQATVFTMDGQIDNDSSWVELIDGMVFAELSMGNTGTEGYGDNVSSSVQGNRKIYVIGATYNDGEFFYDVEGEGWTPDIRAYFDNIDDVSTSDQSHWFSTGFSELDGAIYAFGDPDTEPEPTPAIIGINLFGENGKDVKIYDFDIAAWKPSPPGLDCEVKVYEITLNGAVDGTEDGNFTKGTLLYSKIQIAPRTGVLNVAVNVSGSALRLEVIGALSKIGLDNLRIGQSPAVFCGDIGFIYLEGDVNRDCDVDMDDLVLLLGDWLECTDFTGCP